jgi:S-adenosylmethionine synthetase
VLVSNLVASDWADNCNVKVFFSSHNFDPFKIGVVF